MCDQYYSAFTETKNDLHLGPGTSRSSQMSLHYTPKSQPIQKISSLVKYSCTGQLQTPISYQQGTILPNRNRYIPYNNRAFTYQNGLQSYLSQTSALCNRNFVPSIFFETDIPIFQHDSINSRLYSMTANSLGNSNMYNGVKQNDFLRQPTACLTDQQNAISKQKSFVTLQISNLDNALEETNLRSFLISQLKPITPIVSIVFEGSTYVKVTVPDINVSRYVKYNMNFSYRISTPNVYLILKEKLFVFKFIYKLFK